MVSGTVNGIYLLSVKGDKAISKVSEFYMTGNYRQEKQFGTVLGIIIGMIALWPLIERALPVWWLLSIAAAIIMAALCLPAIFKPVLKVWMPLGHLLGTLSTWLLLAVVFFVLITPMALLFRLLHRDQLKLRRETCDSYWHKRADVPSSKSFRDQY